MTASARQEWNGVVMNHDNDAGGLDGIVALHKLVPAAEELDLLAELRADQDHESQELILRRTP